MACKCCHAPNDDSERFCSCCGCQLIIEYSAYQELEAKLNIARGALYNIGRGGAFESVSSFESASAFDIKIAREALEKIGEK